MGRPIERIEPFLNKVNIGTLICSTWKLNEYVHTGELTANFIDDVEGIRRYWDEYPDLRFSQVLVNMAYIPNIPGFWYYMEEPEILVEQGLDPAECYYWGVNYDKDMNKLPETIYKPIKELSTEHIETILDGGFVRYNNLYKGIMENELKRRL